MALTLNRMGWSCNRLAYGRQTVLLSTIRSHG